MTSKITVSLEDLNSLVGSALKAQGLSGDELNIVRDVLMYAEQRGNKQGFDKIVTGALTPNSDARPMGVEHRSDVLTNINGNLNIGMVVMQRAVNEAIASAKKCSIGLCSTNGTCTSTGAIGYFVEQVAHEGYMCLIFGGTPKAVAPYGSVDPLLGTNPLAFSVPTNGEPFVLDMATSAVSWYGLVQSDRLGESIPGDLAFDESGQPTTEPLLALEGAIRAFGGAKGAGLALMIELITGVLAGGAIVGDTPYSSGNLVMVIDLNAFGQGASFRERASELLAKIKSSRTESNSSIKLPGDQSKARLAKTLESGTLCIDRSIYDSLVQISESGGQ